MPSASVTVTNPTGSSRWYRGSTYNITWSHSTGFGQSVDHFEVRLFKGSSLDTVITTNDNASPKSWTVPSNQTEGTNYRIQVKMVLTGGGDVTYTDYSDYFDIHEKYHTTSESDSLSLADTFASPVLETWKYILTESDTISTSDSFESPSLYTYLTSVSESDSLSLSDTFANPVLDTWHHKLSESDSLSLSDTLATPSVYTYLTTRSESDSLSLSDSLSPSLDTWHYRLNVSDSASVSDTLATPSVFTYLTKRTISDSVSLGDSFATPNLEWWKIITSRSDTISTSDSLTPTLQFWREERTISESLNLSDGLTAQLVIDSNSFYYATVDLAGASTTVGYVSGETWTTSSSVVSQVEGLTDGQTSNPAIFSASNRAGVRFDLGSQKSIDFISIHLQSGETESIKLYGSNSQSSAYTLLTTVSNGNNTWTINELDSTYSYRYLVVQCEANTVNCKIDEVIIGESFKPEVRYDINSSTGLDTSVKKIEAYDGSEYIHKISDDVKKFNFRYPNISATLKNNFETMANKTDGKKLLYWDEAVNYINLIPPKFSEVSHNRYSADIIFHT